MYNEDEEDTNIYLVVKNNEDQYSIWVKDRVAYNRNDSYEGCMTIEQWKEKNGIRQPGKDDVVLSCEEDKYLPLGWFYQGVQGLKQECLDYINEVWTDMRPRSLREFMEKNEAGKPIQAVN